MDIGDILLYSAVKIVTWDENNNERTSGSGVAFLPNNTSAFVYILTAKHVIFGNDFEHIEENSKENTEIWYYFKNDDSDFLPYKLKGGGEIISWAENDLDFSMLVIPKVKLKTDYLEKVKGIQILKSKFLNHDSKFYWRGFPNIKKEKGEVSEARLMEKINDKFNKFTLSPGEEYRRKGYVEGWSGSGLFYKMREQYFLCGVIQTFREGFERLGARNLDDLEKLLNNNREEFRNKQLPPIPYVSERELHLFFNRLWKGVDRFLFHFFRDRFKDKNISEALFPEAFFRMDKVEQEVDFQLEGKEGKLSKYFEILKYLWENGQQHGYLTGKGGIGKTVSILKLCQFLSKKDRKNTPIPIYVELNEYKSNKKFILNYIASKYGIKAENFAELVPPIEEDSKSPSIILFLDGFNEITVEVDVLQNEINDIMKRTAVQIVVSSRNESFNHKLRKKLQKIELDFNISNAEKKAYCRTWLPEDEESPNELSSENIDLDWLDTPMMIHLFIKSFRGKRNREEEPSFRLAINTLNRLIWHTVKTELTEKAQPDSVTEKEELHWQFLVWHILSFIAFTISKKNVKKINRQEMKEVIVDFYGLLSEQIDLFEKQFPIYNNFLDQFYPGRLKLADNKAIEKLNSITNILSNQFSFLIKAGENKLGYRFQDQSFLDFFAALHIRNDIELALEGGKIPTTLVDKKLSISQIKDLKEIFGIFDPEPFKDKIERLLEISRQTKNEKKIGHFNWNLFEIIAEDAELHTLAKDLRRLDLKEVELYKYKNKGILFPTQQDGISFKNSAVSFNSIYPALEKTATAKLNQVGSNNGVFINDFVFGKDEKSIWVAYGNGEILEWNLETGNCMRRFKWNPSPILAINYSHKLDQELLIVHDTAQKFLKYDLIKKQMIEDTKDDNNSKPFPKQDNCSEKEKKILKKYFDAKETLKYLKFHEGNTIAILVNRDQLVMVDLSNNWNKWFFRDFNNPVMNNLFKGVFKRIGIRILIHSHPELWLKNYSFIGYDKKNSTLSQSEVTVMKKYGAIFT